VGSQKNNLKNLPHSTQIAFRLPFWPNSILAPTKRNKTNIVDLIPFTYIATPTRKSKCRYYLPPHCEQLDSYVHVGFLVNQMALRQVAFRGLRFSPINFHATHAPHPSTIAGLDSGPISVAALTQTDPNNDTYHLKGLYSVE
jgi:hypothetical protein